MNPRQLSLFGPDPSLPEGLRQQEDLITPAQEDEFAGCFAGLPFAEFNFHGHLGKRRVVFFGWQYDFEAGQLSRAADMPPSLISLRGAAADFAGIAPAALEQVLVTEYAAGAAIGWHRDKSVFGDVVGVSFVSACVFRMRRKSGATWERKSLPLKPRSAYLLRGPSRTEWEHSIPAVEGLRYSVTFRTLRST
jgi:alkylated DNA repair dioxygenase AlkB